MSNVTPHASKEVIERKNKKFLTNADIYLNARRRKFLKEGRAECPKHPEQYFDPAKFTGCYLCHLEEMKEKKAH